MQRILLLLIAFSTILPIAAKGGYKAVASGRWHHLILKEDGSLWGWGNNNLGQLGDGTVTYRGKPIKIMEDVKVISASGSSSYAIRKDGSLWGWGFEYKERGDRLDYQINRTPVRIMSDKKFMAVSGMLALTIDGQAWCICLRDKPRLLLDNVKCISSNNASFAMIRNDGTLWMFGSNDGMFGNGTKESSDISYSIPVNVMSGVKNISIGGSHVLAVFDDDSLWAWGWNNEYGQIGDGTTTPCLYPVKIMDSVKSISAGSTISTVIDKYGILWGWGRNEYGNLGDGTKIDRYKPVKIADHVKDVSCGNDIIYINSQGELMTTDSI